MSFLERLTSLEVRLKKICKVVLVGSTNMDMISRMYEKNLFADEIQACLKKDCPLLIEKLRSSSSSFKYTPNRTKITDFCVNEYKCKCEEIVASIEELLEQFKCNFVEKDEARKEILISLVQKTKQNYDECVKRKQTELNALYDKSADDKLQVFQAKLFRSQEMVNTLQEKVQDLTILVENSKTTLEDKDAQLKAKTVQSQESSDRLTDLEAQITSLRGERDKLKADSAKISKEFSAQTKLMQSDKAQSLTEYQMAISSQREAIVKDNLQQLQKFEKRIIAQDREHKSEISVLKNKFILQKKQAEAKFIAKIEHLQRQLRQSKENSRAKANIYSGITSTLVNEEQPSYLKNFLSSSLKHQ